MRGKLANIGRRAAGAAKATRGFGDNKAVPLALGGVFAAGLVGSSARSVLDLGNEAAFGDQDADRYFLGERGLSPGTLLDSATGSGFAAGGTALGGALGAAGGGMLGAGVASVLKDTNLTDDVKIPTKFADDIPLIGGKKVPLGGTTVLSANRGKGARSLAKMGRGGLIAAGIGVGAGIGASAFVASHVNRNRDFYKANPYSRGSAMQASSTGAYGDIVLGMHNSRRG
jgi:hypothetical protein